MDIGYHQYVSLLIKTDQVAKVGQYLHINLIEAMMERLVVQGKDRTLVMFPWVIDAVTCESYTT